MLKLSPETVTRYQGSLGVKFKWVAKELFRRRNKVKKNSNGNTSTLKETNCLPYYEKKEAYKDDSFEQSGSAIDFLELDDSQLDLKIEEEVNLEKMKVAINNAMKTQSDGTNNDSDYMKVSILMQSINTSLSEISRNTGIPRYYLSNLKAQGQELLKKTIEI